MLTLYNDFHNTQCNLKVEYDENLSINQIRRAKRELCGVQGCLCGGILGERGSQKGKQVVRIDYEIIRIRKTK